MADLGAASTGHPAPDRDTAAHAHALTVLAGLSRGLVSYDRAGRLRLANQAARDMLGLAGTSAPGTRRGFLRAGVLLDRDAADAIHAASLATARDGVRRELVVDAAPQRLAVASCSLSDGTSLLRIEGEVGYRDGVAEAPGAAHRDAMRLDALTGLPDRQIFSEHIARELAACVTPTGRPLAMLMLDLDRFKTVNDTLGHLVGDELLRLVSRRMRSVLSAGDLLTRLGGDEFGIMLVGRDPAGVEAVSRSLLDVVGRPYLACGHVVNVGVSVGIARAPEHALDAESLMKFADLALYSAKESGRNGCVVFEPAMNASAQARRALEIDLRGAATLGQFEVHYQPQIALDHTRLAGFEALVRWRHPTRGLVSPADFIPVAEEIGLIGAIGDWVLQTACREAATWPGDITLAVNVSVRQFEDGNLVDAVRRALAASGLPTTRLELEITESVLMRDEARAIAMLHDLRALGVRVAMDDFGTGYSSLSQLRAFPFDKIKIDRSFVANLTADGSSAIIRAIAAMGTSLGMSTIAEGVETSDELAQVRAEGCNAVQGFFFSRPVPSADLPRLIATLNEPPRAIA